MGIKYALTLLCILEIFHIPETHQLPLNSSEVRENKQNKIRNPQDQGTTNYFGRPCNYLNRCSGDTWCSKDERCTCKRSYHLNDTLNCVKGNGLVGSICFNGLGCEYVHNTKCSVEKGRGKCVCPAGFHGIEGGTQCAEDSKIGDPCGSKTQCTGNSECKAKHGIANCTCKQGFYANDNLVCVQGNALIGSHCFNGLGCEFVRNAKCSLEKGKGECICPAGFHGAEGGAQCTAYIDEPCKGDDSCIDNAFCTLEKICKCKDHYTASSGREKCLAYSKIGDPCGSVIQCTGNSECKAKGGIGYCTCKEGFHANDNLVCVKGNAHIGSNCSSGLGCEYVGNSKCSVEKGSGKCVCPAGFHGVEVSARCAVVITDEQGVSRGDGRGLSRPRGAVNGHGEEIVEGVRLRTVYMIIIGPVLFIFAVGSIVTVVVNRRKNAKKRPPMLCEQQALMVETHHNMGKGQPMGGGGGCSSSPSICKLVSLAGDSLGVVNNGVDSDIDDLNIEANVFEGLHENLD